VARSLRHYEQISDLYTTAVVARSVWTQPGLRHDRFVSPPVAGREELRGDGSLLAFRPAACAVLTILASSDHRTHLKIAKNDTQPCTFGPDLHGSVSLSAILPPCWSEPANRGSRNVTMVTKRELDLTLGAP
jgi:hypothetical protein